MSDWACIPTSKSFYVMTASTAVMMLCLNSGFVQHKQLNRNMAGFDAPWCYHTCAHEILLARYCAVIEISLRLLTQPKHRGYKKHFSSLSLFVTMLLPLTLFEGCSPRFLQGRVLVSSGVRCHSVDIFHEYQLAVVFFCILCTISACLLSYTFRDITQVVR
jgi:hypothetical protein